MALPAGSGRAVAISAGLVGVLWTAFCRRPRCADSPVSYTHLVTVSAYLDDMEVRRETINPKNTTSWKPSFSGEGIGRVKIYIDDEIYMEYIVDFDEGIHEIDSDYSQDFQ